MKRYLISMVVGLVMMMTASVFAQGAFSSGLQTGNAIISSGTVELTGALIITNGTNNATLIVYGGTTAAGPVLFKGVVQGAAMFGGATWEIPVRASGGIYATISGTGANYIIYSRP